MRPILRLGALAAILHLVLVALGAAHLHFSDSGFLGRALESYATLSGANNTYPFFAPEVGSQLRARFTLINEKGERFVDTLEGSSSRETVLRLSNIIGLIADDDTDEDERRSLAGSWAGNILGRHPEARAVEVRLEGCDLPSMNEYRQGMRTSWTLFYEAKFLRSPKGGKKNGSSRLVSND
jgi:hypothetical protein